MAREDKPPALAQNKATLQIQIPLHTLLSLHIHQSPTAPSPPRFCPTFSSSSLQKPMLRAPPWAAHRACKKINYTWLCAANCCYVRIMCGGLCATILTMCGTAAHYVHSHARSSSLCASNCCYVRIMCGWLCATILIMCGTAAHYVHPHALSSSLCAG